jgi:hypothetical protein
VRGKDRQAAERVLKQLLSQVRRVDGKRPCCRRRPRSHRLPRPSRQGATVASRSKRVWASAQPASLPDEVVIDLLVFC